MFRKIASEFVAIAKNVNINSKSVVTLFRDHSRNSQNDRKKRIPNTTEQFAVQFSKHKKMKIFSISAIDEDLCNSSNVRSQSKFQSTLDRLYSVCASYRKHPIRILIRIYAIVRVCVCECQTLFLLLSNCQACVSVLMCRCDFQCKQSSSNT